MPLADDIRAVRDRALAELDAAHDYFAHSEAAWALVNQLAAASSGLSFRNDATGTVAAGADLADLAQEYFARHVTEATFQQFLNVFEAFVGDLLRLWLTAFPRAMSGKTVKLEEALDAGDLPTLVARFVDQALAGVTYKSPRKVVEYMEQRIGITPPAAADVDRLAEAKATRDVMVHNRGVADAEYLTKAGALARCPTGQLIDVPKPYHRAVWELLKKLVGDLSAAVLAKVP